MNYGTFSKDGSEFVVTRFDTPRPWLNCIHNDVYGVFFSQIGQGYSFYRSAMGIRLNYIDIFGYVPTHPQSGKYVYLRDMVSGRSWPAFPMHSAKGYRRYRCAHGQGYSEISAVRNGIEARFLLFVPSNDDPVEVWRISLRNIGTAARKISVFPFQEWHLTAPSGITDTLTYTRTSWRADLNGIVARMTNPTSPLVYDAFMSGDFTPEGTDCGLDAFMGTYAPMSEPQAVTAGACTNSIASGERMCGVLNKTFDLAAGDEVTFNIITGVSFGDGDVRRLTGKYLASSSAIPDALAETRSFWAGVRAKVTCRTSAAELDVAANSWLKHQTYVAARYTRGLMRGYRDILQDIMGLTPLDSAYTRHWLIEALKHQYSSGLCLRQFDPIGNHHDMRLHRDSPAWIPGTLSAYVRETGDLAFLDEQVPFFDSGKASVFEHAMAGLRRLYEERSGRGLCLIGDGDWNDSLNEVSKDGKGESVWLTIAAVYGMQGLAEVARMAGRNDASKLLLARAEELSDRVNEHGWDGRWYVYAFTDDGRPVGSDQNAEGKIHLNVQTWAIFTDVARGDRLASVLDVIDNTMDTEHGAVLIHPAYTRYVRGIGKLSGKNPGMAENGPVYSHGVAFKMLADLHLGRGDKAFESYMKVLPNAPGRDQTRFEGEPFASSRYLIGPGCPERFGASPYSHFSGSAAWGMQLVFERMLGVRPEIDGLRISPCIPASWKGFEVVRPFRGDTYRIRVSNPRHIQRGVAKLTVDGRTVKSNLVPVIGDGCEHDVRAIMG